MASPPTQGNLAHVVETLAALSRVALLAGERENAARLRGAVDAIRAAQQIDASSEADDVGNSLPADLMPATIDDEPGAAAYQEGQAMSVEDAAGVAGVVIDAIGAGA
ncbi:MAG TPA: hypothetical protein VFZ25_03040 [Chloroflexota bacterium]|nr:hypothetical protein [Chloroflexota bacterium]